MAAAAGYSLPYVCSSNGCNNPSNGVCSAAAATPSPMATPASCSTSVPPIATGGLTCYVGDVGMVPTPGMLVYNASWRLCLAVDHADSMGSTVREYRGLDAEGVATATVFFTDPAAAAAAGYSRAVVCATDSCNSPASPADVACRLGQASPTPTPGLPCTSSLPYPAVGGLSCWTGYTASEGAIPPPVLVFNASSRYCLATNITAAGLPRRFPPLPGPR